LPVAEIYELFGAAAASSFWSSRANPLRGLARLLQNELAAAAPKSS